MYELQNAVTAVVHIHAPVTTEWLLAIRSRCCMCWIIKGVLYSILGPDLVSLTVDVWNIVGRCFSPVCRALRMYCIVRPMVPENNVPCTYHCLRILSILVTPNRSLFGKPPGTSLMYPEWTHTHTHTDTHRRRVILGLPRASSGRQWSDACYVVTS